MSVPVDFLLQAELDLIEFVPLDEQVVVLEAIIERIGTYPEIGGRLEPPAEFARAHGVDQVERVEVLRIVPDAFAATPRLT